MSEPDRDNAMTFPGFAALDSAQNYFADAAQRTVLFWDVMRQRGNAYREHIEQSAPHVLEYNVELLIDGRTLERPVNYCLVRVLPPPKARLIQGNDRSLS